MPPTDRERHGRRSIRLPGWDYRQDAIYFVTLCTFRREPIFRNPDLQQVAELMWVNIPKSPHARHVTLDEWIIMHDHMHGILVLNGYLKALRSTANESSAKHGGSGTVGTIIRTFKSQSTRRINALHRSPGGKVWQRNYYESIIRDERQLAKVRRYIRSNPRHHHDP